MRVTRLPRAITILDPTIAHVRTKQQKLKVKEKDLTVLPFTIFNK